VFLEINGVVDHNYNESMLLQAMLYLAEDKMDGKLFAPVSTRSRFWNHGDLGG